MLEGCATPPKSTEQIGGPGIHQSSLPLTCISVAGPKHTFLSVVVQLESCGNQNVFNKKFTTRSEFSNDPNDAHLRAFYLFFSSGGLGTRTPIQAALRPVARHRSTCALRHPRSTPLHLGPHTGTLHTARTAPNTLHRAPSTLQTRSTSRSARERGGHTSFLLIPLFEEPTRDVLIRGGGGDVADPTPCVTFRLVVVPLRGPGQSPVLPFACCAGLLLSVGRCGRCSCWCHFRVRGAQ